MKICILTTSIAERVSQRNILILMDCSIRLVAEWRSCRGIGARREQVYSGPKNLSVQLHWVWQLRGKFILQRKRIFGGVVLGLGSLTYAEIDGDEEDDDDDDAVVDDGDGDEYEDDEGEVEDDWSEFDFPNAYQLAHKIAKMNIASELPNIISAIKAWGKQGNTIDKHLLLYLMITLSKRKRFTHALKIADWMENTKIVELNANDRIRHLELMGRHGNFRKAQRVFDKLSDEEKNEKAYNALLLIYSKAKLVEQTEGLFKRMKKKKVITSAYPFNLMATFYNKRKLPHRVIHLFNTAKQFGVSDNCCLQNNLLTAKFKEEGIHSAEEVFTGIISSKTIQAHVTTYLTMARCYCSVKEKEKAIEMLEKAECGMQVGRFLKSRTTYRSMMSMYAGVGSVEGVEKVWKIMTFEIPATTHDYIYLLKACGELGDVGKGERVFREAEENGKLGHIPMCRAMMYVYAKAGLCEKCEALKLRMMEMNMGMDPRCYHYIVCVYVKKGEMKKSVVLLREMMNVWKNSERKRLVLRPIEASLGVVLNGLAKEKDVESAERVFAEWKWCECVVNVGLYNKLLRVYVTSGVCAYGFGERMIIDGIRPNKETEILVSKLKHLESDQLIHSSSSSTTSFSSQEITWL